MKLMEEKLSFKRGNYGVTGSANEFLFDFDPSLGLGCKMVLLKEIEKRKSPLVFKEDDLEKHKIEALIEAARALTFRQSVCNADSYSASKSDWRLVNI